jgi:senataxin
VEPSTLVPLAHGGAKQVFLVGDPVQLPATVMSQRALAQGYSDSLFKRLQGAGYPVHMLDTQYRMHPVIREFPSTNFYGGGLKDGPGVAQDTQRPWHASPAFQPLVFIDVKGTVRLVVSPRRRQRQRLARRGWRGAPCGSRLLTLQPAHCLLCALAPRPARLQESVPEGSSSLVNEREAEVVLQVYRELRHRHPQLGAKPSVAVISPYKAQVGDGCTHVCVVGVKGRRWNLCGPGSP